MQWDRVNENVVPSIGRNPAEGMASLPRRGVSPARADFRRRKPRWLGLVAASDQSRSDQARRAGSAAGKACKPIAATATTKIASHCTLPEPPCRPFAVENLATAAFATRVGLSSVSSRGMARPQAFAHPFINKGAPDDRGAKVR